MTLVGSTPRLARLDGDGRPWWRDPFRVFQTNLRETDAVLDVDRTLDAIHEHGSNVWLINGGGIMSFYPTDLPFQTRNPYLADRPSGDLLGDAVAAAHERGIRVVARMDFSKVTERVAQEHPDWLYVDPAGEHQVYEGLSSTCPAAGYYQEAAFAALTEVAERYDVDGFFFNWFGFNEIDYSGRYRGVSQNAESVRRFREWSGGDELPTGPESANYVAWQRFATETIDDLTARFRSHIATLLPGAAFIRGPGSDVVFHEANNEIGRPIWPFATSEAVSAARAVRPAQPVFVNSVAFVDMPYRLAAEEPSRFRQYIVQTIARGGNPSAYIMGEPGAIDYPNVTAVGDVFRFHRDHADIYRDAVPAARIALVRPDPLRADAARHARSTEEFRGLFRALQQCHLPFDVLPLPDVRAAASASDAGRFAVYVVPDCGELDDATVDALDVAVDAGALVILTGSSGATGRALAASPVAEYGPLREGRDLYAAYSVESADAAGHPRHPVVPVFGEYRSIRTREGARAVSHVAPPVAYGPPEKAHGNIIGDEPGIAVSGSGRGAVAVIPWTIGRSFHHLGLSVARDAVVALIEQHDAEIAPVRAEFPPHVEVVVLETPSDLIVHAVNVSGVQGNGFTPPVPIHGGRLTVPGRRTAIDGSTGRPLDGAYDTTADTSTVEVPSFDTFAVVRVPRDGASATGLPGTHTTTEEVHDND